MELKIEASKNDVLTLPGASVPVLSNLSDDVLLNIFFKLEDDPRHWSRIACVCTRFNSLIGSVCCKAKCSATIPSIVSDLLHSSTSDSVTFFASCADASGRNGEKSPEKAMEPPGGWLALLKVNVCCPGLLHAGVLFDTCDYGLERAIGPDHDYAVTQNKPANSRKDSTVNVPTCSFSSSSSSSSDGNSTWSLFDDLFFDTVYDESECKKMDDEVLVNDCKRVKVGEFEPPEKLAAGLDDLSIKWFDLKRRKKFQSVDSHAASGIWNLSREQGNKLLASRFRGDCLYICDWPGCEHAEERRNYKLFRGVFKNFKKSGVWRSIKDSKARKIGLNCAFCSCEGTWDMLSSFCLRRLWEYHDDGEPVVRAYVCENGHVSGAWTDHKPICT